MRSSFILIFITLSTICLSQHTDQYNSFVSELKIQETKTDTTYFENGIVSQIFTKTKFKYQSLNLEVLSSDHKIYSKKGILKMKYLYDDFGNVLNFKKFDKIGNLKEELIVSEIDLATDNYNLFLTLPAHKRVKIKYITNFYKYSKKTNIWYIRKSVDERSFKKLYTENGDEIRQY